MIKIKIITVGTLKGGTGKTSLTFNLSGVLAEKAKILLIDADPQCNLSNNVGIDVTSKNLKTIKDIFENDTLKAENVIFKEPIKNLSNIDIIPSNIQLTATEINVINRAGREQILNNFIKDNHDYLSRYEYIIIDTNPSMGIINQNAFLVADSIILVSDVSLNSIQGSELFIALWGNTTKQLRKADNIKALIINNYDKRIKLSNELLEYCHSNQDIKSIILKTVIPNSVKMKETELEHTPINILHKNSTIHQAFTDIIQELAERAVI